MRAPEPLSSKSPIAGFDCGKPSLNDWLQKHALQAQGSGSARTFVVTDKASVLGYYSLVVGQVEPIEATERIRKGMGQYPIPTMLLTRLAVATSAQGQGIGMGLLQDALRRTLNVAEQAGIRALLTHPIDDDAARFYQRFGFEVSPLGQGQLLLLLTDAKRWV
ncbi:MAG: GNAT family N-acetyltransferase [Polaromonas sp.]